MHCNALQDVVADQLADLWSAQRPRVDARLKVVDATASDTLRCAVEHHLAETRGHVARLERVIGSLGLDDPDEDCEAMRGLVREGERAMSADGNPLARDVALLAGAQHTEHHEIAAYGTVCARADELGLGQVGDILCATLNEERGADQTLTMLATGGFRREGLDEQAARSGARAIRRKLRSRPAHRRPDPDRGPAPHHTLR